ncbi:MULTISPECIES: ABC transporter permease [Pseudoxanthomonas]|jgi:sodium transport system permease protein|uniref:ABC transporter permease n=1 Tax=Pseudoxanthomonas mexicana TaxID=128785 RepID=A0ABX6R8T1_PSEMX|nr:MULTISPECIES: ABC transporter permease [Pseudoxanthomonas]KAF1720200.1 sodium ABC transporter permease [Pseudoxanthomonas mexicana]MCH2092508.1 ABC transporter permease [Pseudoxanthomonas sp.]QLQ27691.1 MAG: ABC transporter permease [Pseudoxanthomonas sp.]QND79287.1 ABC transporter permease [Pseudoxanthomonas mexicana]
MNMFRTVFTVMRKELRDLSRDRRTLALALFLGPLLYPALMLGMGYLTENRIRTQVDKTLEIPMVGAEHAPNLVKFLATNGITAAPAPANLDTAIRSQEIDAALRISPDYAEDWRNGRPALVEIIRDSTRRDADIPTQRLQAALNAYSQQVGALRLLARGIDASVARPVNIGLQDMATPEAKQGMLLSVLLPYLLILTSFIGGAYLILDATAGERERQSLEPLLATPAPRSAVVSGKIAAACMIGLATLLLTLLAFKFSAQFAGTLGRQLNVSFLAIGKMLLILVPMLFIGTSLLTYLAASAKSMKEAQSHMTWLMLLPMIPTFALMANPLKSQPWQFAVPFLAQNQLLLKVIRNEYISAQTWGIYVAAAFGVAALLWYAAVRRYHQEKLAIAG